MSDLEITLVWHIKAASLPAPVREYRFDAKRRWRFDLAWPDRRLAAEVEGGTWVKGRHSRGAGMAKDCVKYNAAVLAGWAVLRFTSDMVKSGAALATIEQALKG